MSVFRTAGVAPGVADRIESLPLGRFHTRLLVASGVGWLFDAMDVGLLAFVLPALAAAWKLPPQTLGGIASVGLFGMAVGAVLSGTLADYFGRRPVFMFTLLLYSLATGLSGLATGLGVLLTLRFLVGFGLGGELPVASTLVSEYSPAAQRGRLLVLLESFWAFGWLLAAVLAYLVIPRYGWQVSFFVGALPALYAVYLRRSLPESARYLERKGRGKEAHALLDRIEAEYGAGPARQAKVGAAAVPTAGGAVVSPPGDPSRVSFATLWSPALIRRTVTLWILWFSIVFSYYGIFTWLPSIMVAQGHGSLIKGFQYVLVITLAQIPGYFSAAYLVDRIGRKPTLVSYLALSGAAAFLFGRSALPGDLILWGSLMSFFNLGAWGVVYTYTPELYPTRARATGAGWAAGFGRLGGIVAPYVVGLLYGKVGGFPLVFGIFTGVLLLGALVVAILGEETARRTLGEISGESGS